MSVQNMNIRRLTFVTLALVAIVAVFRFWPDKPMGSAISGPAGASDGAAGASKHGSASTSAVEHNLAVPAQSPSPGVAAVGVGTPTTSAGPQGSAVEINVLAPATVKAGESFEATVNLDAPGSIRQLSFSVSYDRSVLQLVGSSEGTLVQQEGASARFAAEDPNEGYVLVRLDANDGSAIAGAGGVAVLKFQALKAGTSPVILYNVVVNNEPAGASTTASVGQAAVSVN
jgi:hypothetical protein